SIIIISFVYETPKPDVRDIMMVTVLRYINNVPHLDILTGALLNANIFLCGKIKQFLIHLFIVNAKF
ncbi:unnamed protein product, partial [Rotaria sordida]